MEAHSSPPTSSVASPKSRRATSPEPDGDGGGASTGAAASSSSAGPSESLDGILEATLRELFSSVMTLVNEEDAVLLYRCTKLAETSPLLLEACDLRRVAIEDALADWINAVFHGARRRLNEVGDAAVRAARRGSVNAHADHTAAVEERLEQARLAAKVQAKHAAVQKDTAVREALKAREVEIEAQLAKEWAAMADELSEGRLKAELSAADAKARARSEVDAAKARLGERDKEIERLDAKLTQSEETVSSLSVQLAQMAAAEPRRRTRGGGRTRRQTRRRRARRRARAVGREGGHRRRSSRCASSRSRSRRTWR